MRISWSIALVLVQGLVVHIVQAGLCDQKADGVYLRPSNSNKFYQCVGGKEYDFSCGTGLVYNVATKVCGWPSNNQVKVNSGSEVHSSGQQPKVRDAPATNTSGGPPCIRRVCYYTNWAQYRPTPETKYFPNNIDPNLCTHLVYAFAKLHGNSLEAFEWNDESTPWAAGNYEKATNLKQKNPDLKVLLAVGGASVGSAPFHQMVDSADSRREFITSAIPFLRNRNFDGLDLDWEYPGDAKSSPGDKHKFTLLVQELRQAFDQEASGSKRLLLTAAVPAGKSTIENGYEIPELGKALDFINLMTYDFHGSWDSYLGHNSPLLASSQDTGDRSYLNVGWVASYWAQQGAPKDKLVIGMPFYGRSFTMSGSDSVGAPATKGTSGPYTRESGYFAYYEICELIARGAQRHFLQDQRVPYLTSGNQWIGYDDESSLKEKVRFMRKNGYGGAMAWSVDLDDFNAYFCGKSRYPLLNAIVDECSK